MDRLVDNSAETVPSTLLLNLRLLPGEEIVNVTISPERISTSPPSTLRELYRLAQAKINREVGDFGPILASLSSEDNKDVVSIDLHRYEALFGRDALRVAMDLLSMYPKLTRITLVSLAELQGIEYNTKREEEPGRIIHESRTPTDPIGQELTEKYGWDWPYYGSVDATPEFIRVIGAYCKNATEGAAFLSRPYIDKAGSPQIMSEALTRAVEWVKLRMDSNPEGLIETIRSNPDGIENQVWKDSWDAYFHSNGTIADHSRGVASIEVQRVTYDALLDAAELYEQFMDKKEEAQDLKTRAEKIKKAINDYFWTDDKNGYFIIGTDRNPNGVLRQLKVRASNMGHLLHSRLLIGDDPETTRRRESIISNLFSPEMLTGSGIRTLASDEIRYRPGAYHNGSIWLWDNYLFVEGLRNHGYNKLANNLSERLFNIVKVTKKFPEFVRGDSHSKPILNDRIVDLWDAINNKTNRIEQPPQEVQAWSVAAILAMKHYRSTTHNAKLLQPKDEFEASILAII